MGETAQPPKARRSSIEGAVHRNGGSPDGTLSPPPPKEVAPTDLERQLDELSLKRALIDFDVANARVVDLTHRYVEATEEIKRLRKELDALRIEHGNVLADLDRTRNTKAYKIAERIWALRRALNV